MIPRTQEHIINHAPSMPLINSSHDWKTDNVNNSVKIIKRPEITAARVAVESASNRSAQGEMHNQIPSNQLHQSSHCSGNLTAVISTPDAQIWDMYRLNLPYDRRLSALGQKQTFAAHKSMSASPPKADMCGATRYVRFGSKADMCSAKRHVRFPPNSGHVQRNRRCPLRANSGHLPPRPLRRDCYPTILPVSVAQFTLGIIERNYGGRQTGGLGDEII